MTSIDKVRLKYLTVCVKCKRRACNDIPVCEKDLLEVIVFCC